MWNVREELLLTEMVSKGKKVKLRYPEHKVISERRYDDQEMVSFLAALINEDTRLEYLRTEGNKEFEKELRRSGVLVGENSYGFIINWHSPADNDYLYHIENLGPDEDWYTEEEDEEEEVEPEYKDPESGIIFKLFKRRR